MVNSLSFPVEGLSVDYEDIEHGNYFPFTDKDEITYFTSSTESKDGASSEEPETTTESSTEKQPTSKDGFSFQSHRLTNFQSMPKTKTTILPPGMKKNIYRTFNNNKFNSKQLNSNRKNRVRRSASGTGGQEKQQQEGNEQDKLGAPGFPSNDEIMQHIVHATVKEYVERMLKNLMAMRERFAFRLLRITSGEDFKSLPDVLNDMSISQENPIFLLVGGLRAATGFMNNASEPEPASAAG